MRPFLFGFILFAQFALAAPVANATNAPRFAFSFVDPTLTATAVAVDAQGNTYLAASVVGNPFVAMPGAVQPKNAGGICAGAGPFGIPIQVPCNSAFVIKLDPAGAVVFATYLGGDANAVPSAIVVDAQENVYVAGSVVNIDGLPPNAFPVTPGAAFTVAEGAANGFVVKLNALGTQLEYSTLIPGAGITSIAIDRLGVLYFTGYWNSYGSPFPATAGAYQKTALNPSESAIIGKLNASGSALLWGTYLGGALGVSGGTGIAVNPDGSVLVAGEDSATDFPVTSGQFSNELNGQNVFLAKMSADGSQLIYSSLLGPAQPVAMKGGPNGEAYLCVWADADFPTTNAGFGVAPANGYFLMSVSADGSTVLSSIYLPFGVSPTGATLDVDSAGNAYVLGYGTVNPTPGAFVSAVYLTLGTMVVAKIAPDGGVVGATYAGLSAANSATAIAAEQDGSVVVAGSMYAPGYVPLETTLPGPGDVLFMAVNFFPAVTIENAASYVANVAVPGELASIRGYGLGPEGEFNSAPATNLGGVQVYFDSYAAPIIYAQAEQINVQVPWEIAGQATTQLKIVYNGAAVGQVTLPVVQAQPGVFYIENSDSSMNSAANPARPGDYVSVYGTGGGTMNPAGVTGGPWPLNPLSTMVQITMAQTTMAQTTVVVGGEAGGVIYAGSAPTMESGFFQINVRLPGDATAGAQSMSVSVGGVTGAPAAIWIQ